MSTVAVFIDLTKAFSTIDHSILLKIVENMGDRGFVLQWLQSYLDKRQQYVEFSNEKSVNSEIKCGMPKDQY